MTIFCFLVPEGRLTSFPDPVCSSVESGTTSDAMQRQMVASATKAQDEHDMTGLIPAMLPDDSSLCGAYAPRCEYIDTHTVPAPAQLSNICTGTDLI